MRSGDTFRRDALRFLLAAVKNEEIARRRDALDDAAVQEVLARQAKMRRDSIESFERAGRPELVEKETKELAIVQSYLPQQLSEADVRAVAARVLADVGATGPRDMGKVMPRVLAETKDRADGKQVAAIVSALLRESAGS